MARQGQLVEEVGCFRPLSRPTDHELQRCAFLPNQRYDVVILSAADGKDAAALPNGEGLAIFTPTWSRGGDRIVFVGKKDGKVSLFDQPIAAGAPRRLMPYTSHVIANPTCSNGKVYFEARLRWTG